MDKWDYGQGPSILAAFGSSDPQDAVELRIVLKELLRKSPANIENMGYTNLHDMNNENMNNSERGGGRFYRFDLCKLQHLCYNLTSSLFFSIEMNVLFIISSF